MIFPPSLVAYVAERARRDATANDLASAAKMPVLVQKVALAKTKATAEKDDLDATWAYPSCRGPLSLIPRILMVAPYCRKRIRNANDLSCDPSI